MQERLNKLGVQHVFMRIENKLQCLQEYLNNSNVNNEQVLFMGDDIPDYEIMFSVGLPCCPADAVIEIKNIAKYISHLNGGKGCARDVIEKVLKLRGDWSIDTHIKSQ